MRAVNRHHVTFVPTPPPLLLLLTSLILTICTGADVINTTHTFKDGDTLISSGGSFEFGFFSPGNSTKRYLGIWYGKITPFTVVWVANRDNPVTNTSGGHVLKILRTGALALLDDTNSVVLLSNTTRVAQSPVAQLLDNGNLVVREASDDDSENYLWQSFDHPTDTQLPGMKIGHLASGHENYLSSWKSDDDPGTGDYNYHLDATGYPQIVQRKGSEELFRTGPWNGICYSGVPRFKKNTIYTYGLIMAGREVYCFYDLLNKSASTRLVINQNGVSQLWAWIGGTQGWILYQSAPADACDTYNHCGAYGTCDVYNSPRCGCLGKFIPKSPEAWAAAEWTDGCVRRTPLDCKTDEFVKFSEVKLPDARQSWFNASMTLAECKVVCRNNCNCTAYSTLDIKTGSGCLLWLGELVGIKKVYDAGQDIFVRVAFSESVADARKRKEKALIASLTSVAAIILLGSFVFCLRKRKKNCLKLQKGGRGWRKERDNDLELPLVDFPKISKATNNFCSRNKLGEGGFGPVYKGTLEDGQDIAVKRLSKTSFQGLHEFKNEIICIASLQHRNLVKLLGCCIEGEENMVIYEYMPNKSLDLILFDEVKSKLLDWPMRFHIITGIARGLMYLHQDSRLRIIHRDLKVSNILLDADMNPKISDFGTARIFGGNESEANTSRVIGTYGYMSPEYTTRGRFSMKSDVFSFGVIVLEILSGQRNRKFSHNDHHHNLLGHAWMLHKKGQSLELVQDSLVESCSLGEVLRSIHVGLLCVQAYQEDRPSMSLVVNMLENDVVLPPVKQPGFFTEGDALFNETSVSTQGAKSKNEVTVTVVEPR